MNATLFGIAEEQYGVCSREQALAAGLTAGQIDRRVSAGRLVGVHPGVYRIPGAPTTPLQTAMAATLWFGGDAVVSHLTAATLLRLDGCKVSEVHVTVPRDKQRRSRLVHVHRTLALPRQDRVVVDAIPCTSATRTLIDCAAELDGEALEVAFESARRMGLTSPRALAQRASALGKRPGSARIRTLLSHQEGDPALQFKLEVKTDGLLRTSKLPRPRRPHPVGRYFIDFAYLAQRLGVECDSFEHHGYRLAWKRDKRRTSWIEARGWRLMFVSWTTSCYARKKRSTESNTPFSGSRRRL